MEFKGSKTEQNLLAGFAGESMARTRYDIYGGEAKKQGYEQIAAFFYETANNEKEHAKMMLKFLSGIGDTKDNLKAGVDGEHEEWSEIYKKSAEIAEEEGFKEIAVFFRKLCEVERHHEERYSELLKKVESDTVFKEDEETEWVCRNCGYVHKGKNAPEICPVCKHPKAFFEREAKNY